MNTEIQSEITVEDEVVGLYNYYRKDNSNNSVIAEVDKNSPGTPDL